MGEMVASSWVLEKLKVILDELQDPETEIQGMNHINSMIDAIHKHENELDIPKSSHASDSSTDNGYLTGYFDGVNSLIQALWERNKKNK